MPATKISCGRFHNSFKTPQRSDGVGSFKCHNDICQYLAIAQRLSEGQLVDLSVWRLFGSVFCRLPSCGFIDRCATYIRSVTYVPRPKSSPGGKSDVHKSKHKNLHAPA